MPAARAHVATDRASRYLAQLGKHTGQMSRLALHRPRAHSGHGPGPGSGVGHQDGSAPPQPRHTAWTETGGVIDFGWGRCTLRATDEGLELLAEAPEESNLRRVQEGITGRLEKIGRRDRIIVAWEQVEPMTGT